MNKVRGILAMNSSNRGAKALFERIEQERISKIMGTPQLKAAFRKPISLDFKDTSLKAIFEFISRTSGINFTYDKEMKGDQKATIIARNITIENAIENLLAPNNLEKKVLNENTLMIYPVSRTKDHQQMLMRNFYLTNTDAKKAMAMIKAMLKTRDVYVDEKLNLLMIRDTPENILQAEKLVASIDIAEPEVMLEVEVMEVSRKHMEDIGAKYFTQMSVGVDGIPGSTVEQLAAGAGRLDFNQVKHFGPELGVFSISDPVIAINLLNQDTDTNLLANPQIRVKSREKAKIHIGDKIPVITSTGSSTGFVAENVSYLDVGIKLEVEPTVLLNDEVSIKVGLEVSNQTEKVTTKSGTLTYTLGTRNANTVLRLRNGETQVLAGLFRDDAQDTTSRMPGLSSLPLVGKLFSDKATDRTKKEIVLLITPRVLSNVTPPDSTYTVFPAGFDKAAPTSPAQARQPVAVEPPPAQTPQEIQAERVQSARDAAEAAINPDGVPAQGTSPSTVPKQP
jgi:general secretion pathway protein D